MREKLFPGKWGKGASVVSIARKSCCVNAKEKKVTITKE